jgi:hypothetical protein
MGQRKEGGIPTASRRDQLLPIVPSTGATSKDNLLNFLQRVQIRLRAAMSAVEWVRMFFRSARNRTLNETTERGRTIRE